MAVNINKDQIIGLIIDEYLRLKNFNENHELLNYIIEIDNNGFKLANQRLKILWKDLQTTAKKNMIIQIKKCLGIIICC